MKKELLNRTPPISRRQLLFHPLDSIVKSNPALSQPKDATTATLSIVQATIPFDLAALGYALASKLKADKRSFIKGLLGATVGFISGTTALSLLVNPRITQAVTETDGVTKDNNGQSNLSDLKITPPSGDKAKEKAERIKKVWENLRQIRDNASDEIPAELLHSTSPNNLYKVRRNWWNGVMGDLGYLKENGQIPLELQEEVDSFIEYYTSEEFHNQSLTTPQDIARANELLDKILGSK